MCRETLNPLREQIRRGIAPPPIESAHIVCALNLRAHRFLHTRPRLPVPHSACPRRGVDRRRNIARLVAPGLTAQGSAYLKQSGGHSSELYCASAPSPPIPLPCRASPAAMEEWANRGEGSGAANLARKVIKPQSSGRKLTIKPFKGEKRPYNGFRVPCPFRSTPNLPPLLQSCAFGQSASPRAARSPRTATPDFPALVPGDRIAPATCDTPREKPVPIDLYPGTAHTTTKLSSPPPTHNQALSFPFPLTPPPGGIPQRSRSSPTTSRRMRGRS
jgi:hypothetical protein